VLLSPKRSARSVCVCVCVCVCECVYVCVRLPETLCVCVCQKKLIGYKIISFLLSAFLEFDPASDPLALINYEGLPRTWVRL